MLPLTESLYVSGSLASVDKVLLEIGTGYYVERDLPGSADYCIRKVMLVKDKVEELTKLIQSRQAMKQQVAGYMEQRAGQPVGA
jgi:prefoldin alpha subunit